MSVHPRITLVTPSYQQAAFLERTILSVLSQGYPNLEYMVVDANSTDGSVEIIRRYADHLAWWVSEKDGGQSAGINKGLRRATGEIIGWLNSDDTLAPGSLAAIADAYTRHPDADLIYGHTCLIDRDDRLIRRLCAVQTNASELIRFNPNIFSQPGTTWRRRLQERIGLLDESLHYAMDADYWIRAASTGNIKFVSRHLANLRIHAATKTTAVSRDSGVDEWSQLRIRYAGATPRPSHAAEWAFRVKRWARVSSDLVTLRYRLFGT